MGKLLKPKWQKDLVYLVQVPRAGAIPSVSPYALKLETWLRIAGQIPFIELNGKELADTTLIIEALKKHFNVHIDEGLTEKQHADWTAYHCLVEDTIKWEMLTWRSQNMDTIAGPDGLGRHITGPRKFIFNSIIVPRFAKRIKNACHIQGTGRFSNEEQEKFAQTHFSALSNLLGEQDFFFGSKVSTFDCTVFGMLGQLYFIKTNPRIIAMLKSETPNLVAFLERMKAKAWPDWDEATALLSLDTQYTPMERL